MNFIFTAIVLLGFRDCTCYGAVGDNGGDTDLLHNLKSSVYGVEKFERKDYLTNHEYLDEYKSFEEGKDNRYDHDDTNDDQWRYGGYEHGKNDYKDFDTKEYDYVPNCDMNNKECKDGRDCYDKASERFAYDNCINQYGNEGRYYDLDDRYSGNRYREEDYGDRQDKECYDDYNSSDFSEKFRNRYDKYKNEYDNDCYDNTKNREDYNKCRRYYRNCHRYFRRDNIYSYTEQDWNNEKYCNVADKNLVGLGRRDRDDQLIRPCALDDRQCIRKYLARNSKCKPAYGPIPDPLYLKRNTVYFPLANLTAIRTKLRVTGLASINISEFYVNKNTNNLVIALDFEKLNQTSPRVHFRYQRTAKESIVLYDYASDEYQSGTFTAVIPKIPNLRLDLAEVHSDIDDLLPSLIVGPKAFESKDPDVAASVAKFFANLPSITREFFLFQSQLFTAIYIQENLCDFGLKLTSV